MVLSWGFSESHLSVEEGIQDWGITWLPSAGFCSSEAQPGHTQMSLLGQLLHEAGRHAGISLWPACDLGRIQAGNKKESDQNDSVARLHVGKA